MKAFKDEPRPHAVVGEKFVVVDTGRIVILHWNDGSENPYFKYLGQKEGNFFAKSWCLLAPFCKGEGAESILNTQVGGDHYKKMGDYQPWQVFEKWMSPEELKGFMKGTTIGYLSREQDKGGRQDIEKAMHTIQIYLQLTKEQV
ncbi:MAG: hypothetical protein BA874_03745 [Desulfuromonadales bacterium C00003068]|jgi:uncharacterized protein YrzB (UPF0473 family)|nr:MAG: hypothetical protein BA874_03745 [Desulfuromonadales bacterium C00003068]